MFEMAYFLRLLVSNCDTFSRSSRPEVFCKKVFLKIRKIHRKTPVPESLECATSPPSCSIMYNSSSLSIELEQSESVSLQDLTMQ